MAPSVVSTVMAPVGSLPLVNPLAPFLSFLYPHASVGSGSQCQGFGRVFAPSCRGKSHHWGIYVQSKFSGRFEGEVGSSLSRLDLCHGASLSSIPFINFRARPNVVVEECSPVNERLTFVSGELLKDFEGAGEETLLKNEVHVGRESGQAFAGDDRMVPLISEADSAAQSAHGHSSTREGLLTGFDRAYLSTSTSEVSEGLTEDRLTEGSDRQRESIDEDHKYKYSTLGSESYGAERDGVYDQTPLPPRSNHTHAAGPQGSNEVSEIPTKRPESRAEIEDTGQRSTFTSTARDGEDDREFKDPIIGEAEGQTIANLETTDRSVSAQQTRRETLSREGMRWNMLLSTEALEDAHLSRASSVTDAHVLRRKGRLKEQDGLIEFIVSMHTTHSAVQVMEKMERWVGEHFEDPLRSTLSRLIPSVGRFYTPLPLVRALQEYDEFASLSRRRYVPPNFAEIRHVLNIAQVHAIAEKLSLLTFDADGTLYADGHHIEGDNKMIGHIIKLMQQSVHVAIVTAAGYPGNAARYEDRLAGLLAAFEGLKLPSSITRLFHVMGGECNYLLHVNPQYRLEFVPDELWKPRYMQEWAEEEVCKLLDDAEFALRSAAARLRLPIELVRKPRAVGAVPKEPTIYEVLEEMALTVQVHLVGANLPFCAFNGGNDVFVDVGNKSVGLGALMRYLGKRPQETLHVGDRFTLSGNDSATRSKCSILWVANPEETAFFTRLLLKDIRLARLNP